MKISILLMVLFMLTALNTKAQTTDTIQEAQDAILDTSIADVDGLSFSEDGEEVAIGNFWDLIRQAGPIRFPIFGIFLVGVFLIIIKTFDLIMDKRQSVKLESAPLRAMNLNEMFGVVNKQSDNMLSRVSSTMLNVFNTGNNTENLHDEVVNYIRFQQDHFGTFRNRVDFLSDTAGALGLLGTVWGMFIVFSSGNLEKEIILTGMGIALLTTLLGLIVSIALNFASTLTHGYFMTRLEQVKAKAEEMRFRLLEIEDHRKSSVPANVTTNTNHAVLTDAGPEEYQDDLATKEIEPITEKVNPAILKIHTEVREAIAGSKLENVTISVTGTYDEPAGGVLVYATVVEGGGRLTQTELITDASGNAYLDWSLGLKAGPQIMEAKVDGSTEADLCQQLTIQAHAGNPKQLILQTNHQTGEPGKKMRKPLIAEVRDEFGNPVEGCNVHLEVTTGNGKLEHGKESVVLSTNQHGQVSISLTLDKQPGFNVVDVSVKKAGISKKYQAMGQEVLV